MKKFVFLMWGLVLLFSPLATAHATLFDIGGGVIFDNDAGQYWIQDLSIFTNQTYTEQLITVGDLNASASPYASTNWTGHTWGNWHMASYDEMRQSLWEYTEEIVADLFVPTSVSPGPSGGYENDYLGRYDELRHDGSHAAARIVVEYLSDGTLIRDNRTIDVGVSGGDAYAGSDLSAWVTASAMPNSVPEPATLFLLMTGVIGFLRFMKK